MKEHECYICGGLVPVLGGEFRQRGRRTVFVCVDCCSDYEVEPELDPPKRRKIAKPKVNHDR